MAQIDPNSATEPATLDRYLSTSSVRHSADGTRLKHLCDFRCQLIRFADPRQIVP